MDVKVFNPTLEERKEKEKQLRNNKHSFLFIFTIIYKFKEPHARPDEFSRPSLFLIKMYFLPTFLSQFFCSILLAYGKNLVKCSAYFAYNIYRKTTKAKVVKVCGRGKFQRNCFCAHWHWLEREVLIPLSWEVPDSQIKVRLFIFALSPTLAPGIKDFTRF